MLRGDYFPLQFEGVAGMLLYEIQIPRIFLVCVQTDFLGKVRRQKQEPYTPPYSSL